MSNKIYEVQKELDRGFHLYGYSNRITVYGPRPLARRLFGKRKIVKDPRQMATNDLSHVLKENHPSKNVTMLKDINDKRIRKIERNFSSSEKGISLDNQLTDIKRFKQDKET